MKITEPHRGRTYQIKELEKNLIGYKTGLIFDAELYYHLVSTGSIIFPE